jgi:hypothetical protein
MTCKHMRRFYGEWILKNLNTSIDKIPDHFRCARQGFLLVTGIPCYKQDHEGITPTPRLQAQAGAPG